MFDAWVHMKVDEMALNRIDVGCNEHANPQKLWIRHKGQESFFIMQVNPG